VSRWLVGVKRLVQEVQNVEAPLSPSSVCQHEAPLSLSSDSQHGKAPLNPSSDCQHAGGGSSGDVNKFSSLCEVQPTPVPGNSPSLVATDCQTLTVDHPLLTAEPQLAGAAATAGDTDVLDTVAMETTNAPNNNNNSSVDDVSSCSHALLTGPQQLDRDGSDLMSQDKFSFTRPSSEDADAAAVKRPAISSATDTAPTASRDVLSTETTQTPCDSAANSAGDTATVDDS